MSRASQLALRDVATERPSWTPDPGGEHGEVFTRRWVVELILDLMGYRADEDLGTSVIVEPSCGSGAFIVAIVERLAESCLRHGRRLRDLGGAIHGFDLLEHNAERTRKAVMDKLLELGELIDVAERLSGQWVQTDDFLLADHGDLEADFVVGNPPYIRLEDVPNEVSDAYRRELPTMRGRADIFVGFFERGLSLLAPDGRLAFICADRWMRNQYGTHLRSLVAESYSVDSVLVLHDIDAFEDPVAAYPAITVMRKGLQGPARVVDTTASFGPNDAKTVAGWLSDPDEPMPEASASFEAAELPTWFAGGAHWPAGSPHDLKLVAYLEENFATSGRLSGPVTGPLPQQPPGRFMESTPRAAFLPCPRRPDGPSRPGLRRSVRSCHPRLLDDQNEPAGRGQPRWTKRWRHQRLGPGGQAHVAVRGAHQAGR